MISEQKNYFKGVVIKGEERGRTLGFPTANISLTSLNSVFPESGVYASLIKFNNKTYSGATSIGLNSTFNSQNPTIETYILDFNANIYGIEVELVLVKKIREMIKFENIEALVLQIQKDVILVGEITKQLQ